MKKNESMGLSEDNKIFRQSRHENIDKSLSLIIDGKKYFVKNSSRTGIGFECRKSTGSFDVGEILENVTIDLDGITLYSGSIEIKNKKKIDDNLSLFGAEFSSSLFLISQISSAQLVNDCSKKITHTLGELKALDGDICCYIIQLRAILRQFKATCEQEENLWRKLTFDERIESERIFLPHMSKLIWTILTDFNSKIADKIDVEKIPDDSIYHRIFQLEIYPFFEGSDLARRAFEKPQGYAGDYEMMNQIYRNSYEGKDLFSKLIHNYMTNEASSESVKFRRPYFYSFYKDRIDKPGNFKTLAIACGPAIEVQDLVKKWTQEQLNRIHMTLFDLDKDALEHAQARIYENAVKNQKKVNITFINESVKAFLKKALVINEKYDLIYSGGLFDYLDNPTSGALVRKFSTMLNPGGTMVIGNFTKDNTTKAFCHLVTHWTLLHKTEDEIRHWADGVEDCKLRIDYDTDKINAFLVLIKNGSHK